MSAETPESKRREFVLKAYLPACPEHRGGENPFFATIMVREEFIDQLLRLAQLCKEQRLLQVRIQGQPDSWGPDPGRFQVDMPELIVHGSVFWFRDRPANLTHAVETHSYQILKLKHLFEQRRMELDESPTYLADDPQTLFRMIERLLPLDDSSEASAPLAPPDPNRPLH